MKKKTQEGCGTEALFSRKYIEHLFCGGENDRALPAASTLSSQQLNVTVRYK
jgi:hypothetical protein